MKELGSANVPTYPKAPITEAIIDIRGELPDISEARLASLQDLFRDAYPTRREQRKGLAKLQFGAGELSSPVQARSEFWAYFFESPEGRQVVQARRDGFALSRLPPYESWQPFRDEAKRLWSAFRSALRPTQITRLALRYVNRIDLPKAALELKDYFRTTPEVSPDFKCGVLAGYTMQLIVPQDDIAATLLLNQATVPGEAGTSVSILLDLDLFCDQNVPQDDDRIWHQFEVLRERKNQIFEACITDETRRLFE